MPPDPVPNLATKPPPSYLSAQPRMPGAISGVPTGPGPTPVTAPGAGAGTAAAASAIVKGVLPALHNALNAFPPGTKEYSAVLNMLKAAEIFGKPAENNLVPAGILQMANANKNQSSPLAASPAPLPPAPLPGATPAAGTSLEE